MLALRGALGVCQRSPGNAATRTLLAALAHGAAALRLALRDVRDVAAPFGAAESGAARRAQRAGTPGAGSRVGQLEPASHAGLVERLGRRRRRVCRRGQRPRGTESRIPRRFARSRRASAGRALGALTQLKMVRESARAARARRTCRAPTDEARRRPRATAPRCESAPEHPRGPCRDVERPSQRRA
jgi:hypothetical protein